jgi:hypothetical protein
MSRGGFRDPELVRRLLYRPVEIGRCTNCSRDASEHSIDGICSPHRSPDSKAPRTQFVGERVLGFVDADDDEVRATARVILRD